MVAISHHSSPSIDSRWPKEPAGRHYLDTPWPTNTLSLGQSRCSLAPSTGQLLEAQSRHNGPQLKTHPTLQPIESNGNDSNPCIPGTAAPCSGTVVLKTAGAFCGCPVLQRTWCYRLPTNNIRTMHTVINMCAPWLVPCVHPGADYSPPGGAGYSVEVATPALLQAPWNAPK